LNKLEYNLWKENVYRNIPMDERGQIILDFIKDTIFTGREKQYTYWEKWYATIVQRDEKTEVGIAIRGDGGEGKGTFAKIMEKILNDKFFYINDIEEIHTRFNAYLLTKTFLCINDDIGKGRGIESIKSKVTDSDFHYEIKNGAVVDDKNHFNFLLLSNDTLEDLVPQKIQADKRRWMILEASKKHAGDLNYFEKIWKLIKNKEVIQMLGNYFKNLDIENWNSRIIPDTEEKKIAEIEQNTFYQYIVQAQFSDDDFKEKDEEKWIEKVKIMNLYELWFRDNYDINRDAKKNGRDKIPRTPHLPSGFKNNN